jgi:hypothetical protein
MNRLNVLPSAVDVGADCVLAFALVVAPALGDAKNDFFSVLVFKRGKSVII